MSLIRRTSVGLAAICALTCEPRPAAADEGGVSFWVPGFFGSLAATPQQPGWSFATIYYHTSVTAGGDVAFARQVHRGNITVNFRGNLNASLRAPPDIQFFAPTYVFATPVLGGQAAASLLGAYGRSQASVDATLTAAPLLPGGSGFAISGGRTDTLWGWGDLVPQFSLRWNKGVDNWMVYTTGGIPVGAYDPNRLANLGIGHGAIDAGGGYTYFNPQTGHEFSAVIGFTYNFENTDTNYQNGIDMHLDWGASQFVTKEWQIGLVGYLYNQLSCDSGSGNRVGCFRSRVVGVGPQLGHIFKVSDDYQGYLNVKGYKEFEALHRPEGWNVWVTLAISPAEQQKPEQQKPAQSKRSRTAVSSASAAELPVKGPSPVFNWSGFYFGPHIGGGWANGDAQSVPGPGATFFDPFRSDLNGSGVVAGAQIGFNWQFASSWVVGLEADISGAKIDDTATLDPATNQGLPLTPASSLTLARNINWLASVRGRIGTSWDRALLYFTGGVAWAGIVFQAELERSFLPDIFAVSLGDTRTGWVIGGGLEYAFENTNWAIRGEFLHYQFDGFKVDAPSFNGFTAQDTLGNFNVNVARVGFNYKIGEPAKVAARY